MRLAHVCFCVVACGGLNTSWAKLAATTRPAATEPAARETPDADPDRSLRRAITAGDMQAARAAVKAGANVNEHQLNTPPLIIAVGDRNAEMVRFLLEAGADPDIEQPPCMRTPLMMLAGQGDAREQILELLVAYGVNLDARGFNGATLLSRAALCGDTKLIKLLVKHGANLTLRNCKGETPLQTARQHHRRDAELLLLDSGGADYY